MKLMLVFGKSLCLTFDSELFVKMCMRFRKKIIRGVGIRCEGGGAMLNRHCRVYLTNKFVEWKGQFCIKRADFLHPKDYCTHVHPFQKGKGCNCTPLSGAPDFTNLIEKGRVKNRPTSKLLFFSAQGGHKKISLLIFNGIFLSMIYLNFRPHWKLWEELDFPRDICSSKNKICLCVFLSIQSSSEVHFNAILLASSPS